jgi:hypothetical protein
MSKYLVTADFLCIHRVDRQTPCFYMTDEGGYVRRWKKQYGDLLFDTFDEAKCALTTELDRRISRAWRIEEDDLVDGSTIFVTHD